MSSSPPAERRRWRPSRWTLRTRLVAALITLFAVVCLVIGVVTTVTLHGVLVSQVDDQLRSAAGRSLGAVLGPDDNHPSGDHRPDLGSPPLQAEKTLIALRADHAVSAAQVSAKAVTLTSAQEQTLLGVPDDNHPHTRDLGDLGNYRLLVTNVPGTTAQVITGLPLAPTERTLSTLILVEVLVSVGALMLAGLAGALIVRRSLRPLNRVAATARRVAALPLDSGEVALSVRVPDTDPHTEVGQVGSAMNRMLGHVEHALAARHESEQRVRQFVADASHELRTPLAAIRGYAELTHRMSDEVPPDVTHAIGRVESAAARMTTLVEDMLLLARLDSGRPLAREPVELSRMIVDAVGDAHIADPSHRYHLDLPDEPVVLPGDEQRLHQVLANLLANARTHTPPGTLVTVGLAASADEAVLTVRDNGPGIPPALLPDIFQRFARADTSRSRAAGSTGLGLSIVDAVVAAHGGQVSVSSVPGDTTFTVRLPTAGRIA
jgi:two-component system, OmpR family, sensor kinase